MKKTLMTADELVAQDQLIRQLLATERAIGSFPAELEAMFWQSLANRSLHMIRSITALGVLIYCMVGILYFPAVYFIPDQQYRAHDIGIALMMYLNGAICLGSLPLMANSTLLSRYFTQWVIATSFTGIFFTSLLIMLFATPDLVQQGGYVVILVYMLIYFLTGVKPLTLWITCLVASLLPLPILWWLHTDIDLFSYFYAVILSNFIGFFVSYSVTSKERISFLQGYLLELDKLQAKSLTSELKRLSNEDALTGLFNRRYFNQAVQGEWERALRADEPLSLVFIDVDCFKSFNDTYGHLEGDQALIQVARVLQQAIQRSSDIAARYGGEEFVLLLPNTPSDGAMRVAQRIMRGVDDLRIAHSRSTVSRFLTLSMGIATWQHEPELSATGLLAQADTALYQAKHAGRHVICIYTPP